MENSEIYFIPKFYDLEIGVECELKWSCINLDNADLSYEWEKGVIKKVTPYIEWVNDKGTQVDIKDKLEEFDDVSSLRILYTQQNLKVPRWKYEMGVVTYIDKNGKIGLRKISK